MKKRILSLISTLAVASGLTPIILTSCGNNGYSVTISGPEDKNVTIDVKSVKAKHNLEATISWDNKQDTMIESCTVSIKERPLEDSEYELNKVTGLIKIDASLIKGNIVICVNEIKSSVYDIRPLSDQTLEYELFEPTKKPHHLQDYTNKLVLSEEKYWYLLSGFNIYIGSIESHPLMWGQDYIINAQTGEFTIYGKNITSDVYIDIQAREFVFSMEPSQTVQYVTEKDNLRIAEYRVDVVAQDPTKYSNVDDFLEVEAEITDQRVPSVEGKQVKIVSSYYDYSENQIVVQVASNLATIDKDLFDLEFDLKVGIKNIATKETQSETFNSLYFENVIVNTPDMLTYSDETKKEVTGANDDDSRWEKCDALVIPKTVESIGVKAFDGYQGYGEESNVKWLILDETWGGKTDTTGCRLKEIKESAFQNSCCMESGLYIPSSVETIANTAFAAINSGKTFEVKFGENSKLKQICAAAFAGTESAVGELIIPKNVETIERSAFKQTGFSKITFETGSKLKEIGIAKDAGYDSGRAFYNMKNLAGSIVIPESVEEIYEESFACESAEKSNNVESITIPSNVTKIGNSAFANLVHLKEIDMITWTQKPEWSGTGIFSGCASEGLLNWDQNMGENLLSYLKENQGLPNGWTTKEL